MLGVVDVAGVLEIGADDGPPVAVIIGGVVLGLITLIALPPAWRDRRGGLTAVVTSRVVSALLGVPAFFADDAPGWAPVAVAIGLALTVVAVGLIFRGRRGSARLAV